MGRSARIKRRNHAGFAGLGTHKTFVAVFGTPKMFDLDYSNEAHKAQVKQAKANGFKHPGSKKGYMLRNIVKRNLTSSTYSALNLLHRVF